MIRWRSHRLPSPACVPFPFQALLSVRLPGFLLAVFPARLNSFPCFVPHQTRLSFPHACLQTCSTYFSSPWKTIVSFRRRFLRWAKLPACGPLPSHPLLSLADISLPESPCQARHSLSICLPLPEHHLISSACVSRVGPLSLLLSFPCLYFPAKPPSDSPLPACVPLPEHVLHLYLTILSLHVILPPFPAFPLPIFPFQTTLCCPCHTRLRFPWSIHFGRLHSPARPPLRPPARDPLASLPLVQVGGQLSQGALIPRPLSPPRAGPSRGRRIFSKHISSVAGARGPEWASGRRGGGLRGRV